MSNNRSNSCTKTTHHKRSDSSGSHIRHSAGSNHQRSDSGNSIDSDYHHRHGHHRSKSSVQERERTESANSQCKFTFFN